MDYKQIVQDRLSTENAKRLLNKQIDIYEKVKNTNIIKKKYEIGQPVFLKKGTILHGTYKNLEGLRKIVNEGLISSEFVEGRLSKYKYCVSVWNLKQGIYLNDYINFYSGGTIKYRVEGIESTKVIPFSEMNNIVKYTTGFDKQTNWYMEQTKEARFLPSYAQNIVQIGIIFNSENKGMKELLKSDVLTQNINDEDVFEFINKDYYPQFIIDRKEKDDLFTNRESAILFGIPSCFIEGILVGRKYEKDESTLREIKRILPDCYIANLDGNVIL